MPKKKAKSVDLIGELFREIPRIDKALGHGATKAKSKKTKK